MKQAEKLEVTVHEYSIKVEELNRTIIDITSHKARISQVSSFLFILKICLLVTNYNRNISSKGKYRTYQRSSGNQG